MSTLFALKSTKTCFFRGPFPNERPRTTFGAFPLSSLSILSHATGGQGNIRSVQAYPSDRAPGRAKKICVAA